jgi:hypothetical protein
MAAREYPFRLEAQQPDGSWYPAITVINEAESTSETASSFGTHQGAKDQIEETMEDHMEVVDYPWRIIKIVEES